MNQRGQALEYLLLIGVAILVAAIVITLVISITPSEKENLGQITDFEISTGFGGISCKITTDNNITYGMQDCYGITTTRCLYRLSFDDYSIRECEQGTTE